MCVAVLYTITVAWGIIERPTLRQLAELIPTFLLLVWLLSAAWFLPRCASGTVFPQAEPARPCWTAAHVALVFLLFLLLPGAFALIALKWAPGHVFAASSLAKLLVFCVVMAMIRQRGRNPAEALGLHLRSHDGRVAAGLIAFVAGLPGIVVVSSLWTGFLDRLFGEGVDLRQEIVKVFAETSSRSLRIQIAVAAVLVAPIIEELLFRGLLYGLLRRHVRPGLAMVAVGVLFGAIHDSPAAFVPLSLLGVLMCYLYEKTGRLSVPIIAHLIFNGVMLALMAMN